MKVGPLPGSQILVPLSDDPQLYLLLDPITLFFVVEYPPHDFSDSYIFASIGFHGDRRGTLTMDRLSGPEHRSKPLLPPAHV
jgi:hypothetical protein